jgi:lipoprotein-anchoring transpeptidase ErfK/SrfK
MKKLSRRAFIATSASFAALTVAGCSRGNRRVRGLEITGSTQDYAAIYGPVRDEPFPIPAVKLERVPPQFYRQRVNYASSEPVGTIIVDTKSFHLFLVEQDGTAMRYGVGLGRAGFGWSGRARVAWKQKWPKWIPPEEMIAREPDLVRYSAANGGMEPGLENPLGARALYIFQGNVDTLYRIHGSPEYWTIGKAVSSGCVRMMNQDVIDLYERVPADSPVLVT